MASPSRWRPAMAQNRDAQQWHQAKWREAHGGPMIPLLLQSVQSVECKQQLEQRTEEPVMLCHTLRDPIAALRQDTYSALVLDQNLFDLDSPQTEALVR